MSPRILSLLFLTIAISPCQTVPAQSAGASTTATAAKSNAVAKKTWPAEVKRVDIPCSDGQMQPAMWYASPDAKGPRPLLVGLHTWSSNYASAGGDAVYAEWCAAQGWAFVHPHFRGPNNTPQALGSDRAVQDIVEAVAWAKQQTQVDESRIYLIGVSGGGHMALQMAGRHPEIWAGVSAWCGISDVKQWYADHVKVTIVDGKETPTPDKYARDIEAALGGRPTADGALGKDAWKRSPLSSLAAAKTVPLDIAAGVLDGRSGSVPFTQALLAFNAVVEKGDRLPEDLITEYYKTQKLPSAWKAAEADATYGAWTALFRKTSGNTRVTIFQGGHEIVHQAALNWLAKQQRGKPVVWEVRDFVKLDVEGAESGK
jgi:dipeptidyl aminopeptidase/acylaminoacyl peptidase